MDVMLLPLVPYTERRPVQDKSARIMNIYWSAWPQR